GESTSAISRPVLDGRGSRVGPQRLRSMTGAEFMSPVAAALVIKRGAGAGHRFLLDQPVTTVGRHARSGVFLDDVTVSRRHAELRWAGGELRVGGVGSQNGSDLHGQRV